MRLTAKDINWESGPAEPTAAPEGDDFLTERLVNVIVEGESYRVLAQQGVHALHAAGLEHYRLQRRYDRLLLEYRQLREVIPRRELVTS